jgi:hypothetical protein
MRSGKKRQPSYQAPEPAIGPIAMLQPVSAALFSKKEPQQAVLEELPALV